MSIYASHLDISAIPLHEIDLTRPIALVFGNEHYGVSDKAARLADETFIIPMMGMVQSLNVSVAAAVTLYDALRQRSAKGFYDQPRMPEEEMKGFRKEWLAK